MKRAFTTLSSVTLALAGFANCGIDSHDSTDATGTVQVALTNVPSDVGCLRLTVDGSRPLNRLVDINPGAASTFVVDRLPLGIAKVDALAFGGPCAAVGPSTPPGWVSEAPVSVRIDPVDVAKVVLKLLRNGQLTLSVDFESPAWISESTAPIDLAVIGDTPYGAVQIPDFPKLIADINAAPGLSSIVHLGDIKNGSSRCDTTHFQFVLDNFNLSKLPLLYTPGDNEWTDCHRANNGAYDPLERLATLRQMFFPVPGLSLGVGKKQVLSQSSIKGFELYVENQLWLDAGIVFALVDVPGSNNSLIPWFTDDTTGTKMDDPMRRTGESQARTLANLDWLDRSFALAKERKAAAVVVMIQADMWDGTVADLYGFDTTVQKLAALALAFAKPVLLINGDSHKFKSDNPLAMGDILHAVTTPVPNFTRLVVQGSTTTPVTEWTRLHIDPAASPPFSWTRNPR